MTNSIYEEDLIPLNEIIDILFNLSFSNTIIVLFEKYRDNYIKNPNFKKEIFEFSNANVLLVLSNLSEEYISGTLGKYFSKDGMVLYISNELISKAGKYYSLLMESVENR